MTLGHPVRVGTGWYGCRYGSDLKNRQCLCGLARRYGPRPPWDTPPSRVTPRFGIVAREFEDIPAGTPDFDARDAPAVAFEADSRFAAGVRRGGRRLSLAQRAERDRALSAGDDFSARDAASARRTWRGCGKGHEILAHCALAMVLGWLVTLLPRWLPSCTLSCTETRRLDSSSGRVFSIG